MSSVNKGSAKQRITDKIKASHITNRLQEFALTHPDDPDYIKAQMSGPQVTAAFRLLAKVVPDLKQIEHKGEIHTRVTAIERTIVETEPTDS